MIRALFLCLCLFSPQLFASDVVTEPFMKGETVTMDGLLDEWGSLPRNAISVIDRSAYSGEKDLKVTVQSLHDSKMLYLAVTVQDETFRRTGAGTLGEDKLAFWFGSASGDSKVSVSFLPGDLAGIAQDLRVTGSQGKKKIEALESFVKGQRWMVEIAIPWEVLPSNLQGRGRIPFCLAVFDSDSAGKIDSVASSCKLDKSSPADWGELVFREVEAIRDDLLGVLGLSTSAIRNEWYADMGGTAAVERVLFLGDCLAVLGAELGESTFFYYRLGARSPSDVKDLQLMDVDGNGRQEIVVVMNEYDSTGAYSQEILRVFALSKDLFAPIFGQEIANTQKEGTLRSKIEWKKQGKGLDLFVSPAEGKGVEASNYIDIDQYDTREYEEILLPWKSKKGARYQFQNGKALRSER